MSTAGFSKARLDRMRSLMRGYVERGEILGIVTLVSRHGDTHAEAFGSLTLGGAVAMRPDTIFRLSSVTKPITAVAAMIQRAANALELNQGPPNPQSFPAPDEWIRRLGTLPLMYQPGERWAYSTGCDVLGVLIARASGMPFPDYLRERLFEPLGMHDTAFFVPKEKQYRFATSYSTDFRTHALSLFDGPADGQWSTPPAFASGAGGLVSTASDLLAFGEMMLGHGERGGTRILSRPSIVLMTSDHLSPEQRAPWGMNGSYFDSHGFGFGMSVVTHFSDYSGSVGTFGWDGGMGTTWYCDPREHMVSILMTQAMWTSPAPPGVCLDFRTTAYQAIDA